VGLGKLLGAQVVRHIIEVLGHTARGPGIDIDGAGAAAMQRQSAQV